MKMFHSVKKLAGIALIEVLVTAFVAGVGLMAVASLQGRFTDDSRDNKTQVEARALANAKIEQLRDTIIKTGTSSYDGLVSSTTPDRITGVTEAFQRSWAITNQTAPERKEVAVTVCWAGGCANPPDTRRLITVRTEIAFDSLQDAAMAAKAADQSRNPDGVSSPSTNADSSDEITKIIQIPAQTVGTIYTRDGKTYIVKGTGTTGTSAVLAVNCNDTDLNLQPFENDLMTRRFSYDDVVGNEAIEMYERMTIAGTDYCIPRIRFNGGVIIPIRGVVYSGVTTGRGGSTTVLSVELFSFNASETGAYCVFRPGSLDTSAPYTCYVGGNCAHVTGTDLSVTSCPPCEDDDDSCTGSYSARKVGPGGWRGKVGLIGVAGGSDYYNVCFTEELLSAPASKDTARNYYARNATNGNNEGINKPYNCHNFLIVDRSSTERQLHNECVARAGEIGGLNLVSKQIQRDITDANLFDPTIESSACSAAVRVPYTIAISGTGTNTISVASGGSTADVVLKIIGSDLSEAFCTITGTAYSCNIDTVPGPAVVTGNYLGEVVECNVYLPANPDPSTRLSVIGCPLAFTGNVPRYTVTGDINTGTMTSADAAAAVAALTIRISDGISTVACTNTPAAPYAYTCDFATRSNSVTLTPTVPISYSVSPTSGIIPLTSVSPDVTAGTHFTVSARSVYTLDGSISLGNNVDNISSVSLSAMHGTCSITAPNGGWKKNTSGSYRCTVLDIADNTLSFVISPACSDTKSGNTSTPFKYSIVAGAQSSLGTGTLTIPVTGSTTLAFSVTENTNHPCN